MAKIYLDKTVRDAAKDRIRWCYQHYDTVVSAWSGGKDSTVMLHLAIEVAREEGRLPLDVVWLDQEAEWDSVVRLARTVSAMPEVNFHWYQVPFRLFNASSLIDDEWLYCWGEGQEWMRDREPDSIHANTYGVDRFSKMLDAIMQKDFVKGGHRVVRLIGLRADESYKRFLNVSSSLENVLCYSASLPDAIKARWDDIVPQNDSRVNPIYDWSNADVWKSIHDGDWPYADVYDKMYQIGIPLGDMRVSSLCHEIAVGAPAVSRAAEIEPDTWRRLTTRMGSLNDLRHMNVNDIMNPRNIPEAFRSWKEYRDYLLETIVQREADKAKFLHMFQNDDTMFRGDQESLDAMRAAHVAAMMRGDVFDKVCAAVRTNLDRAAAVKRDALAQRS